MTCHKRSFRVITGSTFSLSQQRRGWWSGLGYLERFRLTKWNTLANAITLRLRIGSSRRHLVAIAKQRAPQRPGRDPAEAPVLHQRLHDEVHLLSEEIPEPKRGTLPVQRRITLDACLAALPHGGMPDAQSARVLAVWQEVQGAWRTPAAQPHPSTGPALPVPLLPQEVHAEVSCGPTRADTHGYVTANPNRTLFNDFLCGLGLKPFSCQFCGRAFRQRSQQMGHEATHANSGMLPNSLNLHGGSGGGNGQSHSQHMNAGQLGRNTNERHSMSSDQVRLRSVFAQSRPKLFNTCRLQWACERRFLRKRVSQLL